MAAFQIHTRLVIWICQKWQTVSRYRFLRPRKRIGCAQCTCDHRKPATHYRFCYQYITFTKLRKPKDVRTGRPFASFPSFTDLCFGVIRAHELLPERNFAGYPSNCHTYVNLKRPVFFCSSSVRGTIQLLQATSLTKEMVSAILQLKAGIREWARSF